MKNNKLSLIINKKEGDIIVNEQENKNAHAVPPIGATESFHTPFPKFVITLSLPMREPDGLFQAKTLFQSR